MCQVIEQACEADSDCPERWTCEENPEGVCWAGPDGAMGCEPADPPLLCRPPYYDLGGYPVRGEDDASGNPSTGTPTTGGAVPPESPSAPQQPGVPSTNTPPSPQPVSGPSGDEENGAGASDVDGRGGCTVAVGPAAAGTSSAFLALAAALAFAVRRRLKRRARA
jgi:MYXO-CTERM domain-containing protein